MNYRTFSERVKVVVNNTVTYVRYYGFNLHPDRNSRRVLGTSGAIFLSREEAVRNAEEAREKNKS